MVGTTKSLGQKDNLDRFYTKPNIVDECLACLDLTQYDNIIEPSAGDGAFSSKIPNCIALDLAPANDNIIQCDYFEFNYEQYKGNTLVIGNPPFGQQSTLAIAFFNRSAEYANTIAFILPKSFKKVSVQNRLSLQFGLVKEIELNEKAFTLDGKDYGVPCVFQVWQRLKQPRTKVRLKTTSDYLEFTKDWEAADFRIQRVGGNAGHAFNDKNGATSSNYYVINHSKLTNEELIDLINSLTFPSIADTVGPKSLAKGELIAILEENLIERV